MQLKTPSASNVPNVQPGASLTALGEKCWRSSGIPDHRRCHIRSQSPMVDHDVMTGGSVWERRRSRVSAASN